jgi:hypothetical protein
MNRFITSSANPERLSTTIKGLLMALVPIIMMSTGLSESEITPIIDGIVAVVFALTSLVAAVQVVYGLVRKVYLGRWSAE